MRGPVPDIHAFLCGNRRKTWMAGTSPAMTEGAGPHRAVPPLIPAQAGIQEPFADTLEGGLLDPRFRGGERR
jgi:hypothetical protein